MSFLNSYLPYLLRQADQTLSAPFYEVLTQHGVARSEWRVLAVLQERGEMAVLDLASVALSPQPTITHALSRLEKRGLVSRAQGTHDKRQRFTSITPAGAALTATLIEHANVLAVDALAGAGDLSALADQLRRLTAAVETNIVDQPIAETG